MSGSRHATEMRLHLPPSKPAVHHLKTSVSTRHNNNELVTEDGDQGAARKRREQWGEDEAGADNRKREENEIGRWSTNTPSRKKGRSYLMQ